MAYTLITQRPMTARHYTGEGITIPAGVRLHCVDFESVTDFVVCQPHSHDYNGAYLADTHTLRNNAR